MDAVRVNDIQKYLDISNIQAYSINGAKITFLLSRPHSKLAKAGFHCCEMCGRSIADPVRFCSIGCKLECAKQNRDDTSVSLSVHWEEHGAHDFYETGEYRSSEKASDTPPMLCDSEDDMHSCDYPIALPMKKLLVDQWGMEHVESPVKKFKSQKLIDRSTQSREKGIVHEMSLSPLSYTSVGDLDDSWSTLSTRKRLFSSEWLLQSNQQTSVTSRNNGLPSLKAQRRKGIPQRAPLH
ncbi:hypothetical protein O6H91_13G067900 [Diphasiastrum complanatum]|nr:hypothetical protein O6H91_13G067900 [Diphasiastrum complanatum]